MTIAIETLENSMINKDSKSFMTRGGTIVNIISSKMTTARRLGTKFLLAAWIMV